MALLDLQGLETQGYGHHGHHHGGSTLTVLGCASQTPSNLSLLLFVLGRYEESLAGRPAKPARSSRPGRSN